MSRNSQPGESTLSATVCRRLLGGMAKGMSDVEVEQIRDQLYTVARLVVTAYEPRRQLFSEVLEFLPESQRSDAEERAAILQFDGKLNRDQAERLAISKHLRFPPKV